jgi:hypothetical protein
MTDRGLELVVVVVWACVVAIFVTLWFPKLALY